MTYTVNTEVINPYGICLGDELPQQPRTPYAGTSGISIPNVVQFSVYNGVLYGNPEIPGSSNWRMTLIHRWSFHIGDLVKDYIRRVYNLSDDIEIDVLLGNGLLIPGSRHTRIDQQTFETEAEALEYVDSLSTTPAIHTARGNVNSIYSTYFTATWQELIDGIVVDRSAEIKYTGDYLVLYTANDFINFLALLLGVTREEFLDTFEYGSNDPNFDHSTDPSLDDLPAFDCETYIKATIINLAGPDSPIEIDIKFDNPSIPNDVTVTVIDGDPIVPATTIENGDGSVVISDDGNINMRNDGGTFFLNEFGNVGFYASGDASLTAESQVQLGSGGTTFNVDSKVLI